MDAASGTTLELLRCALETLGDVSPRTDELVVAMARVRDEIGCGPARAVDVLEMLQSLILELPAVRRAKDRTARAVEVQRIIEACLTAYYGDA